MKIFNDRIFTGPDAVRNAIEYEKHVGGVGAEILSVSAAGSWIFLGLPIKLDGFVVVERLTSTAHVHGKKLRPTLASQITVRAEFHGVGYGEDIDDTVDWKPADQLTPESAAGSLGITLDEEQTEPTEED